MRHAASIGKPETGQAAIGVEYGYGSDRAVAEAEVAGTEVKSHGLRLPKFIGDSLCLSWVASCDEELNIGVEPAQGSSA
jgi:hypothetical protein